MESRKLSEVECRWSGVDVEWSGVEWRWSEGGVDTGVQRKLKKSDN